MKKWKTVKLFISSTFSDMHAERNALIKEVFPSLRKKLLAYKIHLVEIDLRWGVTQEQVENNEVIKFCLEQIDECRPFFLGILGQRYGWVPGKQTDFGNIKYNLDQNSANYSITELEMYYGALQHHNMDIKALFMLRNSNYLEGVPGEKRFVYTDEKNLEKLESLKKSIKESRYPHFEYNPYWNADAVDPFSGEKGCLDGFNNFSEKVREWLWESITSEEWFKEYQPDESYDFLTEEENYHESFAESRLYSYVERDKFVNEMITYAKSKSEEPLLVTGTSGIGKSSLMAAFARRYSQLYPGDILIEHYIGASPTSTGMKSTIRRLCLILKNRFNFEEEVPVEEAELFNTFYDFIQKLRVKNKFYFRRLSIRGKVKNILKIFFYPITGSFKVVKEAFKSLKKPGRSIRNLNPKIRRKHRVIICLDGINQLDELERIDILNWLPWNLPVNVKMIITCIKDPDREELFLSKFEKRPHQHIHVEPLNDEERIAIARMVPKISAKSLDRDQLRILLKNDATRNPLYLIVALEELRGFGLFEKINERIKAFPAGEDSLTELFIQVINRLENEIFGGEVAKFVLELLSSARHGLTEQELYELVKGNNELSGKVDDIYPILMQIRPYLQHRGELLDFHHRNFYKAVKKHYLNTDNKQQTAYKRLAAFFEIQKWWIENTEKPGFTGNKEPITENTANIRKCDELPWLYWQLKDWDRTSALFTNLEFLEVKSKSGYILELVNDIGAVSRLFPGNHPMKPIIEFLHEALQQNKNFLKRRPQCLFQELWNSCWWYDSPKALDHSTTDQISDNEQDEKKLYKLLEKWRHEKESKGKFFWLRSLRPPRIPIKSIHKDLMRRHSDQINGVSYSPDGSKIASCSEDKTIQIWDAEGGVKLLTLLGHTGGVISISWSPDSRFLASGSKDKTVRIWDIENGKEIHCFIGHREAVNTVSWSADFTRLASGSDDKTVRIWDTIMKKEVFCYKGHKDMVKCVSWAPNGIYIASASGYYMPHLNPLLGLYLNIYYAIYVNAKRLKNEIRIWDTKRGNEIGRFKGHKSIINCISWSPYGNWLVSCSEDGNFFLWDVFRRGIECILNIQPKKEIKSINLFKILVVILIAIIGGFIAGIVISPQARDGLVSLLFFFLIYKVYERHEKHRFSHTQSRSLSWSPSGRLIAEGTKDGTINIWDISNRTIIKSQKEHHGTINSLSWSPDGKSLVSGSSDNTMRIWKIDEVKEKVEVKKDLESHRGHQSAVNGVSWSPDGEKIAGGDSDGIVGIWGAGKGEEIFYIKAHKDPVFSIKWSPNGKQLASASGDKIIRIWNAENMKETFLLSGHTGTVWGVSWSPNENLLASASKDNTIRIWDTSNGKQLQVLTGHVKSVNAVDWSPDGKRIASGSDDKKILIWDIETNKTLFSLDKHQNEVTCVNWSKNGKLLASGSWDRTIRIWDINNCKEILCLHGHRDSVNCISWSSDSKLLASGSWDKTVRIWDTKSGREISCLSENTVVNSVNWSPLGNILVIGRRDNAIRTWDATNDEQTLLLREEDPIDRNKLIQASLPPTKIKGMKWIDSNRLYSYSEFDRISIWDTGSGKCIKSFKRGDSAIQEEPQVENYHLYFDHHLKDMECVFTNAENGNEIAYFPKMNQIAPCPNFLQNPLWAVNDGEYITFLKLEGWKTETTRQNVKLPKKDAT